MRRYSVVVTEAAEKDMVGIADYLSGNLANPTAAPGVVDEFERLVGSLEELPRAHATVRDEMLALAGYRWAPVGSYMAFLTVDEDVATVNDERVLHGSRNWREIV